MGIKKLVTVLDKRVMFDFPKQILENLVVVLSTNNTIEE